MNRIPIPASALTSRSPASAGSLSFAGAGNSALKASCRSGSAFGRTGHPVARRNPAFRAPSSEQATPKASSTFRRRSPIRRPVTPSFPRSGPSSIRPRISWTCASDRRGSLPPRWRTAARAVRQPLEALVVASLDSVADTPGLNATDAGRLLAARPVRDRRDRAGAGSLSTGPRSLLSACHGSPQRVVSLPRAPAACCQPVQAVRTGPCPGDWHPCSRPSLRGLPLPGRIPRSL